MKASSHVECKDVGLVVGILDFFQGEPKVGQDGHACRTRWSMEGEIM